MRRRDFLCRLAALLGVAATSFHDSASDGFDISFVAHFDGVEGSLVVPEDLLWVNRAVLRSLLTA